MTLLNTDKQRAAHLLSRTTKTETGCMEFNGCVQSNGYARATVRRKTDYAHRHIYRLVKGEIQDGLDVCHSCELHAGFSSYAKACAWVAFMGGEIFSQPEA